MIIDEKSAIVVFESGGRVRGYVNPGKLDPARDINFRFCLNQQYIYEYGLVLPMAAKKEAASGVGIPVIPIGYHPYDNTAGIMKPAGAGSGLPAI